MKKLIALILIVSLAFSLASCAGKENSQLRIGFLKGPTGVGASYMMDKYVDKYEFTVEPDASAITSAFISGSLDIAAVPTNVASVLWNKLDGDVMVAAVNTLSVLYILENGNEIASVGDLRGKTIYTTGQSANPEYVLNYILRENGLTPGEDVFVEFTEAGELTSKMSAGMIGLCMLPMPNAATVLLNNSDIRIALSVGEEWSALTEGAPLPQGCIIMRKGLKNVDGFLKDYEESILFMSDEKNLDEATALTVKHEIIPNEAAARASLGLCGITFVKGADMAALMEPYLAVMLAADPTSVGGRLPEKDFYYESR